MYFKKKSSSIVKAILGILLVVVLVAIIGQVYAFFHPGYSNIILDPDPVIGWKFAPNIEFVHTGNNWYADELSVHHKTNFFGFLGPDRPFKKPADTARVVLMGDSFVEALQVSRNLSAAGVLDRQLNDLAGSGSMPFQHYEVLNFGVSNLSVGQYLLIWEQYASKFSPDYVFIFVTGVQMNRTTQKKADWGMQKGQISRPSFELVNKKLIRHPVENYSEAVQIFNEEIQSRGGRTKKREQKIWIIDWVKSGDMSRVFKSLVPLKMRLAVKQFVVGEDTIKPIIPALKERILQFIKPSEYKKEIEGSEPVKQKNTEKLELSEDTLQVNLSVIEELNKKIAKNGGKLIVVDASLYFWFMGANDILTKRIHDFCENKGIFYIPLYKDLLETDKNNIWARFPHSYHFNEHGNAVFAHSMLEWIKADAPLKTGNK